jgi:hypothetical protein
VAEWPDLDELKLRLDVESSDHDVTLEKDLAAGIARVKQDVGLWDDYLNEPDDQLSQAALRMAELIATRPEPTPGTAPLTADVTYQRLIAGHRRRFAIS